MREELGRVVEGDDADDDADGLADGVGDHVLEAGHVVHRQIASPDALGLFGEVDEQPLGRDHFGAALTDRLAVLRHQQSDQIVQLPSDQIGSLLENVAAAMRRQRGHDRSASLGGFDRYADILGASLRNGIDHCPGGGIADFNSAP